MDQNQVNIFFSLYFIFLKFFFEGYVRSSQALEIISLIFYIIAAGLIAIGIVNIQQFPYEVAFLGAAGLLFISSIFRLIIN
jgi:hypothetical protein